MTLDDQQVYCNLCNQPVSSEIWNLHVNAHVKEGKGVPAMPMVPGSLWANRYQIWAMFAAVGVAAGIWLSLLTR